jgi:hypothetical protein
VTPTPRSRRALGIPALALAAFLVAAALPRLWRFEAVGEGTDEAYSVMATRAMVEGRFSYATLNDFTADGYQAKFTPVAEAVAVPFVAVLGDRPLAYRLPALLANVATLGLLAAWLARRHGPWAVAGLAALSLLDYRSLVYAQTHRYVAVEQLLLVGAFLAAIRAERTRRLAPALLFGVLCLLAFHAHFFALLVVVPMAVHLAVEAWRTRGGPRRFPAHLGVSALLAAEAAVVLWLFRQRASEGLFGPSSGVGESLRGAGTSTVRMVGGLGAPAVLLVLAGVALAERSRAFADRLAATVVGAGVVLFVVLSLRLGLRPRYGLCLQPFLWAAAAVAIARLGPRYVPSSRWRAAGVAVCGLATAWAGIDYLRTGGGRDAEERAVAVLGAFARSGEPVVYDTGFQDPFRRRPSDLPAFPKEIARARGGREALDRAGVRWLVRSSAEPPSPLYSPAFLARLEAVGEPVVVPLLFQKPLRLTVHRILPP